MVHEYFGLERQCQIICRQLQQLLERDPKFGSQGSNPRNDVRGDWSASLDTLQECLELFKAKPTEKQEQALLNKIKQEKAVIEKQSLELTVAEHAISQELVAAESKARSHPVVIRNEAETPVSPSTPSCHGSESTSVPIEVTEFDRFLKSTGGPRGGWEEDDHGHFMKMRKAKTTIEEMTIWLPGKTLSEIIEHDEWCKEHNVRLEAKRKAIERWKEDRKMEKLQALQAMEAKKMAEEEEKRQLDLMLAEKRRKSLQEKKDSIKQWRERRAASLDELRRSSVPGSSVSGTSSYNRRNEHLQRQLEEYRLQKADMEAAAAAREAEEARAQAIRRRNANREIAKTRCQMRLQWQLMKKHQEQKKREKQAAAEAANALRMKNFESRKNASRLFAPTQAHLRRIAAAKPASTLPSSPVMSVRTLDRKGVPAWRQVRSSSIS